MKFRNTTLSSIEQKKIPTDDSIVVTTDASLVSYCADDVLHMVNRPDWHIVKEPIIQLISNGILNADYVDTMQFGSNNGAGGCRAYQMETLYRLYAANYREGAWIRWKVDFDKVDYVDVRTRASSGFNYLFFKISDTKYDPSVSSWVYPQNDPLRLYSEMLQVNSNRTSEFTFDVSQITGAHWMYLAKTGIDLFDIELRK